MLSGGSGAWRSRGSREAMPNPVSLISPLAGCKRILAGLMSLCTRPRWWSCARAPAMAIARGRKSSIAIGAPSRRASGWLAGSSSTSMVWPGSRTNASGRTAHGPSSSSFKAYSCARRSRVAGAGCSAAGNTASTARRLPSAPGRQAWQKTRSPSSHKTWKFLSPSAPNRLARLNCRTPSSDLSLHSDRVSDRSSAHLAGPDLRGNYATDASAWRSPLAASPRIIPTTGQGACQPRPAAAGRRRMPAFEKVGGRRL